MAAVFDNQGQYEKAMEWYRRDLAGYEKDLGKDILQLLKRYAFSTLFRPN
jgi:hypothetical protein